MLISALKVQRSIKNHFFLLSYNQKVYRFHRNILHMKYNQQKYSFKTNKYTSKKTLSAKKNINKIDEIKEIFSGLSCQNHI